MECSIEEVAEREVTLAAALNCLNQSVFNMLSEGLGFGRLFKK